MADVSQIKLPNGTSYTLKDEGALQLTGGNVTGPVSFGDSVSIDEATIGDLVVNGNVSFANAKSVTHKLVDSLDLFTSTPVDGDTYLASYADGLNTSHTGNNTYGRRPIAKLWDYIATKLNDGSFTNKHYVVKNTTVDLGETDNGITEAVSRYYGARDKDGNTYSVFQNTANTDGSVGVYIAVRNKKSDGTFTGWTGITLTKTKTDSTTISLGAATTVNSTLRVNNLLTLYRESTTAQNYGAGISFSVKDTTTGITDNNAYIYVYEDHASSAYGTNMVIQSGGGIFIGSGESPGAHYSAKGASYTGEDTFITADGTVYIQANGNTIANRLGFYIDTSQQVVPCQAETATNNVGSLGTSSYKWANLYVTNINGVAVGTSPKFTDNNTTYALSGALSSHKFTSTLTAGGSGSGTSTSDFTLAAGTGITITDDTSARKMTIACSVTNTDAKVTQSVTTTSSWRKVLLHYTTNDSEGDVPAAVTNQVYAAKGVEVQPSTGTLSIGGDYKTFVTGKGYYLVDSTGFEYPAARDNGSNLWIGATQSTAQHHRGGTYISTGHNGTAGNSSIYIAIPNADNTGVTSYHAYHTNHLPVNYATCSTAAATKDKVASLTGTRTFELITGTVVGVKFTNTNTYSATSDSHVTLNVSATGAKNIYYANALPTGTNTTAFGRANYVNYYMYDGTNWVWMSSSTDNNTTYSSQAAASGGTTTSLVTTGEKYTWNSKAPGYQYSTTDLTAGTSALTTGTLYFVYV